MRTILSLTVMIFLTNPLATIYASEGEATAAYSKEYGKKTETINNNELQAEHDEYKTKETKKLVSSETYESEIRYIRSMDIRINALHGKIKVLEEEVSRLNAIKPSFTTLMPDFSERFHVMHVSGMAGNWAMAAHEIHEMQRMIVIAKIIDYKKGKLLESFIGNNLLELAKSIKHANIKSFNKNLMETLKNCNQCHVATEAHHIEVVLDVDNITSIRHAHKIEK
jgi:hypothetical protein